mmetsp:Transcript_35391/g.76559  ORF Transcript_35391/g.76559 Transcript_35391/m.76559 type:complete len:236 (+) Transcript_35391:188-895(+)
MLLLICDGRNPLRVSTFRLPNQFAWHVDFRQSSLTRRSLPALCRSFGSFGSCSAFGWRCCSAFTRRLTLIPSCAQESCQARHEVSSLILEHRFKCWTRYITEIMDSGFRTVSIHSVHSFRCFILTHKSRLCNLHPPVPSSKSWNLHRGRYGHRASFRRRVVLLPDPSGVSVQNVNNSTHALRPMLSCHPLQTVQTTVVQSIPILRLSVSAMWWLPTKDLNVRKRSFENEVKVFSI